MQRVLDAITGAPAWVRNGRADVLAVNRLGYALYSPVFDGPVRPANTARFTFLDPRAPEFYRDWEKTATDMVGVLHAEAGRNPYDRGLTDLIGELSTRSGTFRTRWAAHHVRFHRTGVKQLHHPVVGDLDLTYEALELPSEPDLTLIVYTAEAGTPCGRRRRARRTSPGCSTGWPPPAGWRPSRWRISGGSLPPWCCPGTCSPGAGQQRRRS